MHAMLVAAVSLVATVVLHGQQQVNLRNLDFDALDTSCKPCDDFYQFSMGKWFAAHPIPETQTRWGKRWAGADGNLDVLKSIVDELVARPSSDSDERMVSDFYGSCLATASIDALGASPIAPTLRRIDATADRRGVEREIAEIQRATSARPAAAAIAEVTPGFRLFSAADPDGPRQTIARLAPPGLGLPDRDYYLKDDAPTKATQQRYLLHIERLLILAGFPANRAHFAASRIFSIEASMAREQLTRAERRDPQKMNTHVPVDRLGTLAPHFDWAAYYRALGLKFGGVVNVVDVKSLREFDRHLQEDSIEDWKLYLAWNVVRANARDLSAPFQQEMFAFIDQQLGGMNQPEPRWKFCIERTDALLGDALGRAYVKRLFPPAAKAKMQEMVQNILAALKDSVLDLDWMSAETKQKAIAKIANITPKVGYPDQWQSSRALRLSPNHYFENVTSALRFKYSAEVGRIGRPTDRGLWRMSAPTSNAYYNATLNEIVFPAGILVPPMFSVDAEDAANYGAIGVVIGHEISHGFDDHGSQFDADGRLANWWTPEDRKRFTERVACVADQFENYFIEPGVHHNGKLVLGESIGDLAGARIAYRAYLKSLRGKERPPAINGFSPEQRFFLSWGQARGDSIRIEQQRLMVVTDPHPVAKYRVNGPFSNMSEFRQAFGCKEPDPMVRPVAVACTIW